MPFKFAVITVVHANAAEDSRLKLELIRQADACLHRRNAGVRGDLFFVGVDFDDDAAFRELLKTTAWLAPKSRCHLLFPYSTLLQQTLMVVEPASSAGYTPRV